MCEKVFFFNEEMIREYIDRKEIDYKFEFELSVKDVLVDVILFFVDFKLYLVMVISFISEYLVRRSVMENVIRNLDSLIIELDMEFKRKR